MSACFSGKYHLAIRFGQEANQLFEHIGHSWGLASTLPRLGFAYLGVNELDTARELFQRGLNISQKLDMTPMSLYALAGIACTVLPENQNAGINLLGYVVTHDKTPMAFIEKPLSLLESSVQSALTKNIHTRKKENNTISISEMVKWIGQEVNLSQGIQYNGNDDEH